MTRHTLKLYPASLEKIRSGRKTIEMRLNDEKRRAIAVGDEILFANNKNPEDKLLTEVTARLEYATWDELIANHDPLAMGYAEIPAPGHHGMGAYYSKSDEVRWGVLGLQIRLKEQA